MKKAHLGWAIAQKLGSPTKIFKKYNFGSLKKFFELLSASKLMNKTYNMYCIGCVMVSMLASHAEIVDRILVGSN